MKYTLPYSFTASRFYSNLSLLIALNGWMLLMIAIVTTKQLGFDLNVIAGEGK